MDSEHYFSLSEAAALLPGNPHISTMHRWRLRGVRGVKLRTALVGGRRYTTEEWLQEFVEATSNASQSQRLGLAAGVRRESEISAAEAELFGLAVDQVEGHGPGRSPPS